RRAGRRRHLPAHRRRRFHRLTVRGHTAAETNTESEDRGHCPADGPPTSSHVPLLGSETPPPHAGRAAKTMAYRPRDDVAQPSPAFFDTAPQTPPRLQHVCE